MLPKLAATLVLVGASVANTSFAQTIDIDVIIANQAAQKSVQSSAQTKQARTVKKKKAVPSSAVRQMQVALNYFQFDAGFPDGVSGRKTREAIGRFQAFSKQPVTGYLSYEQSQSLISAYKSASAINPSPTVADIDSVRSALAKAISPNASEESQASDNQDDVQKLSVAVKSQSDNAETVTIEISKLTDQLTLLNAILEHQRKKPSTAVRVQTELAIEVSIKNLARDRDLLAGSYQSDFLTPVYPVNANLGISALKASEIFPKIPYYLPGTAEVGEMWVEPTVTDTGMLIYLINFMDNSLVNTRIKETLDVRSELLPELSSSLRKVFEWSEQANDAGIRRNFEKVAYCFEKPSCGKRGTGFTSSEIRFAIYEDGSTAVKLQKNKGGFTVFYNLSVESGLLLAAYLDYMHDIGEREFRAGAMTDDELDSMFK